MFTVGSYTDWLLNTEFEEENYNSALHYSYDVHGNVDTLTYDVPWLQRHDARYKITAYTYDLISGKVNKVSYQPGMDDSFYHKYEYDGDNRLVSAYTSRNGWVWDEDARYNYYLHGPLMRTEVGEDKVQGVDYAYTLQGWLKGVNSSSMMAQYDMGKDGFAGFNQNFVKDAFAYSIDYYNDSVIPSCIQRGNIPTLNAYLVLCRCCSKKISKCFFEIVCLNASRY